MKKIYFLLLSGAMIFSSCSEQVNESPALASDGYTFGSTIQDIATRATISNFEAGDQIGVSAYTDAAFTSQFADNVLYTYNGSEFTSSDAIAIAGEAAFRAVYPYQDGIGTSFEFEIAEDQTSASAYTLSDLMTAETALTSSSTPFLSFYHRLSQINVTISGVSASSSVEVKIATATTVDCDLASNTYEGTGSISEVIASIGSTYYTAIVAPQTLTAGTTFATITVDGTVYEVVLSSDLTLQSGVAYLYEGKVTETGEFEFTSSINPWEDGGTLGDDDNTGGSDDDYVLTSGSYTMNGLSYFDATWYSEDITLSINEATNVVTVKGLFYGYSSASVTGMYDAAAQTVTISDWQNLGAFTFTNTDGSSSNYDVYFANAYDVTDLVFNLNEDCTAFETDQVWGYYVDGANGWYEVYTESNLNVVAANHDDGTNISGNYTVNGYSYFYEEWYEEPDVMLTHTPSTAAISIAGLMDGYAYTNVEGTWDSATESFTCADWQYLGTFSFSIGDYDVYFANADSTEDIVFYKNEDGTYAPVDQSWGYSIDTGSDFDTNYWYDIYTYSNFELVSSTASKDSVVITRSSTAKNVTPVTSTSMKSSVSSISKISRSAAPIVRSLDNAVVLKDLK